MNLEIQVPDRAIVVTPMASNLFIDSFVKNNIIYEATLIDLKLYQQDVETILRLYTNPVTRTIAPDSGEWHVAEVIIPARSYHQEPVLDGNGDPVLDEAGHPTTITIADETVVDDFSATLFDLGD
jgi:hypothetical protein